MHDGPGIRTTVFLKGCPLRCSWCQNPESWAFGAQLAVWGERCTDCMACVPACPQGAHMDLVGRHWLDREACRSCGTCVASCPEEALRVVGDRMTVGSVIEEVLRDAAYHRRSGGGITLSGGEPLAQPLFCAALLRAARREGVHTCLDTSGAASRHVVAAPADDVDLFLFDWKATDPGEHRRLTGASNGRILANLELLCRRGARIVLRCPLVPGVNDSHAHLAGIAGLAARFPEIEAVDVMPYHALGRDKAHRFGLDGRLLRQPSSSPEDAEGWLAELRRLGCANARLG